MQREEGMLGLVLVVSDVAVPTVSEFDLDLLTGHVMRLLLRGQFYLECLQIPLNEGLDKLMLSLALLPSPPIGYVVVECLGVTAHA
jgi:hypothetical protein